MIRNSFVALRTPRKIRLYQIRAQFSANPCGHRDIFDRGLNTAPHEHLDDQRHLPGCTHARCASDTHQRIGLVRSTEKSVDDDGISSKPDRILDGVQLVHTLPVR